MTKAILYRSESLRNLKFGFVWGLCEVGSNVKIGFRICLRSVSSDSGKDYWDFIYTCNDTASEKEIEKGICVQLSI